MTSIIILLTTILVAFGMYLLSICRKLDTIIKNLEVIKEFEHCMYIHVAEKEGGLTLNDIRSAVGLHAIHSDAEEKEDKDD